MKKILVNTDTTQTITDNGELILTDISKTFSIKLDDTDKFFMVYFNMLQSFYEIKYLKDMKLLIKLVEAAEYNTGKVSVTTKRRLDLCKELEVTNSNLSAAFKRLLDLNLLKGGQGEYMINECAFWKGEASIRRGLMKENRMNITITVE